MRPISSALSSILALGILAILVFLTSCSTGRPDTFELAEASDDFREHIDHDSSIAVLGVCMTSALDGAIVENVSPADDELYKAVRKHWSDRQIEAPHQLDYSIGPECRNQTMAALARRGYLTTVDLDSLQVHGCVTDLILVARVECVDTRIDGTHVSSFDNQVDTIEGTWDRSTNLKEEVPRPEPNSSYSEDRAYGYMRGSEVESQVTVSMQIYELKSGHRVWKGTCQRSATVRLEDNTDRMLDVEAVTDRLEDPDEPRTPMLAQPEFMPILFDALDDLNEQAVKTYYGKAVDQHGRGGLNEIM